LEGAFHKGFERKSGGEADNYKDTLFPYPIKVTRNYIHGLQYELDCDKLES